MLIFIKEDGTLRINRVAFATELARADINLKTLASRSGLSRSTITSVRSGKSCSQETANKLASGLGIPATKIIEKGD